jgi:hypothetical protein
MVVNLLTNHSHKFERDNQELVSHMIGVPLRYTTNKQPHLVPGKSSGAPRGYQVQYRKAE